MFMCTYYPSQNYAGIICQALSLTPPPLFALIYGRIVKLAEELELQLSGDKNVKEFVSECVEDTDSRRASDTTFELFRRIVGLVLECDENGIREFLEV